ncbi:BACON domain-containing protein, partial [Streptomyces thermolilacinus]|uniref:BACON domain-containing protein n=1 Tax=Streptomyces thermolilacinus TaxID=285540 RepID=UPI003486F10E
SVEVLSSGSAHAPALSGRTGPGRVTVTARPYGDATMLTLTASGGSPVGWSLRTDAPWLYASRTSGTLEPGTSVTVYVSVDRAREPRGPWSARIHVSPSGAVVSLTGYGSGDRPAAPARPKPSDRPSAPPTAPQDTPPDPAPTPPANSEPPPATEPPPSSEPPPPTDTPPPATDPPASEPPAADPQPQ